MERAIDFNKIKTFGVKGRKNQVSVSDLKTPGIDALLSGIFKMPTRVADPQEYYQMPPGRDDASYVNAAGTIRYILSKERNAYSFIDAPKALWDINDFARREDEHESGHILGHGMGDTIRNIMERIKESFKDLFI